MFPADRMAGYRQMAVMVRCARPRRRCAAGAGRTWELHLPAVFLYLLAKVALVGKHCPPSTFKRSHRRLYLMSCFGEMPNAGISVQLEPCL